jgi:tetratricopeptide (TPR) repeat protein
MKTLDEILDERVRERVIMALRELDPSSFKDLMVKLMENLGLEVTAAALSDGLVHLEAGGKEGNYLILVSGNPEDGRPDALLRLRDKARYMGRLPVLAITVEMDEEARNIADREEIAYADRSKLLLLLKKYDMEHVLLNEMDRRVLAEEGSRALPSIGRVDSLLKEAEADQKEGRHGEALAKLDRASRLKPNQEEIWRRKARLFQSMGEHQRALAACREALRIREDSPDGWFLLALILRELGDFEAELEAYDSALRYRPRMVSALINKGATLYELGRHKEAIKVYDRLLEIMPREGRAMNNRALVLKALGKPKKALAQLEMLLRQEPGNRNALINRASLLQEMGQTAQAIEGWKELISLDRRNVDAWLNLGKAQRSAGFFEEAAGSFAVAVSIDPERKEAAEERDESLQAAGILEVGHVEGAADTLCQRYLQASRLLEALGEPESALGEVNRCLELEPGNREALRRRAQLQLTMGHLEEALASIKEALRWSMDPRFLLDLEALMHRMGRDREGKEVLERVEDIEARRREALISLGRGEERALELSERLLDDDLSRAIQALALLRSGRFNETEALLNELLRTFPLTPELINQLGVCLRFQGELERAREVLQRALEISPRYADAWNNLGCVFYVSGAQEEAEGCYKQALLVRKVPEYLVNLGISQLSLGNLEGAGESFMHALRMAHLPEAINGLGMVAERKKELVKSLEFYEAALERAPHFQDALMNRDRVRRLLRE